MMKLRRCSARFGCRFIRIPLLLLVVIVFSYFLLINHIDSAKQSQTLAIGNVHLANNVHKSTVESHHLPAHEPEVKYTYITGANSSAPHELGHGEFDTYAIPRRMSCQSPSSKNLIIAQNTNIPDLTVTKCQKFCVKRGTVFAALFNGSNCYCMDVHGTSYLEKDSECNITCSGDKRSKCGGVDRWMFYKIAEKDGVRGWTLWMSFGREVKEKGRLMTRYRGCTGDKHKQRDCTAGVERKTATNIPVEALSMEKHFIGCFTHQTWQVLNSSFMISNISHASSRPALECIEDCQSKQSLYSVIVNNRCICSDSLGWSRPVDTCIHGFGALVLSSKPLQSPLVSLKFEARQTKKNIAVVAHYRAGSSFASLIFSEYPGALYVFEPASVYHVQWKGVNMSLANEAERSKSFLRRIYPLWFDCDGTDLPGIWLSRFPGWGEHNKGFEVFEQCKNTLKTPSGPYSCSPYLEEKCLIAPIVTAKTTRMIHSDHLREFSRQATNIDLVHVFRDPRGTLQSRAKMEAWYRESQAKHLEVACWELNRLGGLFDSKNRSSNLHSMHYEDIASDAVGTARKMYKELGLEIDSRVIKQLQIATGQTDAVRRNAFDVIQRDPASHINSWAKSLKEVIVREGDNSAECRQFFKSYPLYYKPLKEMKFGKERKNDTSRKAKKLKTKPPILQAV